MIPSKEVREESRRLAWDKLSCTPAMRSAIMRIAEGTLLPSDSKLIIAMANLVMGEVLSREIDEEEQNACNN